MVRDDHWGTGATPFQDLIDPSDSNAGMRVVTGVDVGWGGTLGPDRIGSDLAIAVDPKDSSRVWVAWCDLQAGVYTLHVRRSTDLGKTWSLDLLKIGNAKNPGLAISRDQRIGVLYQQLTGPVANRRWEEHIQFTREGSSWQDHLLANTAATNWTGDYSYLMTHGRDFYCIFAADNTPDLANFPHGVRYQRNANFATKQLFNVSGTIVIPRSIDPFFFKVSWIEEAEVEEEELDTGGIERLEIKGLKYEKLEIRELKVVRRGEHGEDENGPHGRFRPISRLLRQIAADIHDDDDHRRRPDRDVDEGDDRDDDDRP